MRWLATILASILVLVLCAGAPRPLDREGDPRGHDAPNAPDSGVCIATGEAVVGCAGMGSEESTCCSGFCQTEDNSCCKAEGACDSTADCCSAGCTGGECDP